MLHFDWRYLTVESCLKSTIRHQGGAGGGNTYDMHVRFSSTIIVIYWSYNFNLIDKI